MFRESIHKPFLTLSSTSAHAGIASPIPATVGVLHGAAASRFMALVSRPALTCRGGQVRPGERQEACLWPSGPSSYSQAGGILPKSPCSAVRGVRGVGCQTLPQCCQQGAAGGTPPVHGTSSPSAVKQQGWGQAGILAPTMGLQGAWRFPLNGPKGLLHPGRGSQPHGSGAGLGAWGWRAAWRGWSRQNPQAEAGAPGWVSGVAGAATSPLCSLCVLLYGGCSAGGSTGC